MRRTSSRLSRKRTRRCSREPRLSEHMGHVASETAVVRIYCSFFHRSSIELFQKNHPTAPQNSIIHRSFSFLHDPFPSPGRRGSEHEQAISEDLSSVPPVSTRVPSSAAVEQTEIADVVETIYPASVLRQHPHRSSTRTKVEDADLSVVVRSKKKQRKKNIGFLFYLRSSLLRNCAALLLTP